MRLTANEVRFNRLQEFKSPRLRSSALGAFKASLKHLGIIEDARMAPPQIPLNSDEIAAIIPFLKNAGLPVKS